MLILASSSPRRKELLKKITTDFVVISPDIDEGALSFVPAKDLAAEESKEKAYAIKAKYPNDEIISCDTIVVLESGEVLSYLAIPISAKESKSPAPSSRSSISTSLARS